MLNPQKPKYTQHERLLSPVVTVLIGLGGLALTAALAGPPVVHKIEQETHIGQTNDPFAQYEHSPNQ